MSIFKLLCVYVCYTLIKYQLSVISYSDCHKLRAVSNVLRLIYDLSLSTDFDPLYTVSKKTGPLRWIWHNFTNSQHLLIMFGREKPYLILNWYDKKFFFKLAWNQLGGFHNNSSDLTHLNSEFLGWLRTTYYRQVNKRVAKRSWACVKAERLHFRHLL